MAGGKDFVTQGPTEAVLVLRDPPGSLSYAYARRGFGRSRTVRLLLRVRHLM